MLTLTVCAVGVLSAAALPRTGLAASADMLLVSSLLAAIAGSMSVRIPRLNIQATPGDAFVFSSLIAVGPLAAPLVAALSTVGALVGPDRRPLSIRTAFNLGTTVLAASAAAWTWVGLADVLPGPGASTGVLALLAAAGSFFLVNTLLVATAIRVSSGRGFFDTWRRSGLWTATSTLTSALVAFGLVFFVATVGAFGLLIGLAAVTTIAGSYRLHRASRDRDRRDLDATLQQLEREVDGAGDPLGDGEVLPFPVPRESESGPRIDV
ncbi:MAG: hypothetical protein GY716_17715 [bacterium]|nr:hypothetical protein [bacterium]